jgi:hypothetical protein
VTSNPACIVLSPSILSSQIHPKHSIPSNQSKGYAILTRFNTIHELAPLLIVLRVEDREIRATAGQIARRDVHKEGGEPVAAVLLWW